MSKVMPSILDELRPTLMEVIDVCPVDQCNPVDCPLFALRKLPRRERLRWFKALNTTDLRYLADYHKVCMGLKLAARLQPSQPPPNISSSAA
jgi:hypothetical protein